MTCALLPPPPPRPPSQATQVTPAGDSQVPPGSEMRRSSRAAATKRRSYKDNLDIDGGYNDWNAVYFVGTGSAFWGNVTVLGGILWQVKPSQKKLCKPHNSHPPPTPPTPSPHYQVMMRQMVTLMAAAADSAAKNGGGAAAAVMATTAPVTKAAAAAAAAVTTARAAGRQQRVAGVYRGRLLLLLLLLVGVGVGARAGGLVAGQPLSRLCCPDSLGMSLLQLGLSAGPSQRREQQQRQQQEGRQQRQANRMRVVTRLTASQAPQSECRVGQSARQMTVLDVVCMTAHQLARLIGNFSSSHVALAVAYHANVGPPYHLKLISTGTGASLVCQVLVCGSNLEFFSLVTQGWVQHRFGR